jgi:hypothetical protein
MTATTNDVGHVALGDNVYQNVILQFPKADTYVKGTIMARKDISDTIGVAYSRSGTSTYTVAASCHASVSLELGAYVVTAGTLTTGYGPWTAVSPVTGKSETITTAADTDNLVFTTLGLTLTVTAGGGTTWDTGDVITVTTTADGDTVIYDPDGTGGAQTPTSVMPYEETTTGVADVAGNVITGGKVNKNRLVIDDTTTVTDVHVNMLKDVGIFALDQDDVSMLDNIV